MAPEDRRQRVAATLPNPGDGGEALSMTPVYGQTQRARVARPCARPGRCDSREQGLQWDVSGRQVPLYV